MTGQSIATGKRITSRRYGAKCVFRKTIGDGMKERKTNEFTVKNRLFNNFTS